jgi:hypothetical protein
MIFTSDCYIVHIFYHFYQLRILLQGTQTLWQGQLPVLHETELLGAEHIVT